MSLVLTYINTERQEGSLWCKPSITDLTRVPWSMMLDISAGETSMKRRKEKLLALFSAAPIKKTIQIKVKMWRVEQLQK